MADLPNGTTIGGKKIIHKGIANNHRHDASDIDGLNTLATGSQGDGGGIDADVLSGNTYGDLSNEFLLTENDTIPELILANHPTQNNNAVSRLYLQDSIPQNIRSGEFYGITSIGDQSSSTYDYSVLDSYNIRFGEIECLINGFKYTIPTETFDIRDVNSNFENKVFYTYVQVDAGVASMRIQEDFEVNEDTKIFIGTLETNAAAIDTFTPINGIERVGVGRYMLSNTPKEYAIPVSDSTGKIDNAWIFGARGETLITLNGPTEIFSGGTFTYSITNYNSFSEYEARDFQNELTINFIDDETFEIIGPDSTPIEETIDLIVSKDGYETIFQITSLADPAVTISGPTEINSGGANYQYTIGNYNPDYTYTVTTTHGTVSRTDDTITLITPATLENDVTATITVSREGSSDSIDVTILAQAPFDVIGPDEIWQSGTFTYTIDPYVSENTYTVEVDDPNITVNNLNNGNIQLTVPANTGTNVEYSVILSVISLEEGTSTKDLTVLGDPDPFTIDAGGSWVNIYERIGSPEPALNYTVNLYGTAMGVLDTEGFVTYNHCVRTGFFTNGSTLTLNIDGLDAYAKGGAGGGRNDLDGDPGGDALLIQTPTALTITNSTLRAGGGGGGQATRYYTNLGSGGKSQSTTLVSKGAGGGGGTWASNSLVSSSLGNVSEVSPSQALNSNGTAGGTAVNNETGPNGEVHGTYSHFGGNGGNAPQAGAPSTGSSNFDDSFTYSEGNVGSGSTTIYEGYLGVGGAAGLAIKGNGNITSYNESNNVFVGNVQL